MRQLTTETFEALESGALTSRDLVWFEVKDRHTGDPVRAGFWTDFGETKLSVIDPRTQTEQVRTFKGAGSFINVGGIALATGLTVQTATIELSQVSDANKLIRGYDVKQGRVEIYRGLFHNGTLKQQGSAYCRFSGFIDEIKIKTPAEGGSGAITITINSHVQQLRRSNPATRSDACQRLRDGGDAFRAQVATVATWEINWGGQ